MQMTWEAMNKMCRYLSYLYPEGNVDEALVPHLVHLAPDDNYKLGDVRRWYEALEYARDNWKDRR